MKKILVGIITIAWLMVWYGTINAIDQVTSPTCYMTWWCKDDKLWNKYEFKWFTASWTSTLAMQFEKNGVAFTWSFSLRDTPTASSQSNWTNRAYFLNNYYWPDNKTLVFAIVYAVGSSIPSQIRWTTSLFIINEDDNAIYPIWSRYQNRQTSSIYSPGPWSIFATNYTSTQADRYWGDFILGNLIIGYNSSNSRLYYYTFSSTGAVTEIQNLAQPSWFVAPSVTRWPFEWIFAKNCADCTLYARFNYVGIDEKLRQFNEWTFSVWEASTSDIYPLNPQFIYNWEYLMNIFYNTSSSPYRLWKARQLLNSNWVSAIIDWVDQSNLVSPFVLWPQAINIGSKLYFGGSISIPPSWANSNYSVTINWFSFWYCALTCNNPSTNNYPIWSYDLACKTPWYNNCRIDSSDGFKYCANPAGEFSAAKEKCDDPAISINVGNETITWQPTSWSGNTYTQDPPSSYISVTENGNTINYQQHNCLYMNPDTSRFSNNMQFCRIDWFSGISTDEKKIWNSYCQDGSNLYFHWSIDSGNIQLKMAVCSRGNNAALISWLKDAQCKTAGKNIQCWIIPDKNTSIIKNSDWTFSIYWMTLNSWSWSDIIPFNDNANLFKFWSADWGIISAIDNWTILQDNEALIINRFSPTNKNTAWVQFNYYINEDYYRSCTFLACHLDDYPEWNVYNKFIAKIGTGSVRSESLYYNNISTIIETTWVNISESTEGNVDNSIFSCDSNNDGDVSIIEGTICPVTILYNIGNKTIGIVGSMWDFFNEFLKIWQWESTPLFWFSLIDSAYAGSSSWVLSSMNWALSSGIYTDDNVWHDMWVWFFYAIVAILFFAIISILFLFKK